MNKYTATPGRALSSDFTERTLMRSLNAKKYGVPRKDFVMKTYKFLKQPTGALMAIAVVLLGAAGTYAAVNWFNGHVGVKTDNTVISLDLSSCKNAFLPGFPDNQDMHNAQFKILGQPHISEADLKQKLLTQCENDAVIDFYHSKPSTKDATLHSGKVVAVGQNSLTLSYTWGGQTVSKQFDVTADTTFYNQSIAVHMTDLKIGQPVIFATAHKEEPVMESVDPLQDVASVLSVFVTQYDTMLAPGNGKHNFSYQDSNIMPLDMYNQLHKK